MRGTVIAPLGFLLLLGCWAGRAPAQAPTQAPADPALWAREVIAATGARGGLIVHLGCGDGRRTAALRIDERFTVQGLERDPARVREARERIAGLGLYGPVSVDRLSGPALPYADDLINLIVAEEPGEVAREEMLRALAPGGVAYVREGDGWKATVKPWPQEIDEWSHYLHDAGGNAVARDERVGPPRALRWAAPPLWLRSHETPSGLEGLVTAGGRLFYYLDDGLIGITDQRLPERWSLVCRDAFNGKLLWKRPVAPWGWPEWAAEKFGEADWTTIRGGRTVVPEENQRRLVAQGDRLYATLGFRAPLSILDAATGEVLATVEGSAPAREILASEGVVVVHVRDSLEAAQRRRGAGVEKPSRLVAARSGSGEVLWRRAARSIGTLLLAIDRGRVIFQGGPALTCLELSSGEPLWEVEGIRGRTLTLIAHEGVVVLYGRGALEARDGATGERLWLREEVPPSSGGESPDLFVMGGLVWRGIVPIDERLQPVGKSEDALAVGYDLRTGEEKRRVVVRRLRSPEHHHRCYRNKATERYIISGMEGAEFLDLRGDDHRQQNWLRGACKLGVVPANGLLYVPPDQCFCQPGAKVLGFVAASAGERSPRTAVPDELRLEKGPAFGKSEESPGDTGADDWPTFRHDAARHGSTRSAVPPRLEPSWRTQLAGTLTAPVAAGGRAFVAARDAHALYALDIETGQVAWKYVAGGRIDSPPTVHGSRVLFGSADGWVYALRASDGALAWRFLAAPSDLRIGCFDQIESAWPVHGSVLVRGGVAYFAAGRSTYLDGGIRLYGLDPATGAMLHRTTLVGPFPDPSQGRDEAFWLPGANSDVLVSEGDHIYLRQKKLTPELEELTTPVLSKKGEGDVGLHVFSTAGLLDGSWYNRTFWMYSKRWPGFQLANQAPKSGQLLVVDESSTYAVKVFYRRNVHSTMFFPGREGYLLFADRNSTEPQIVGEEGSRKPVAWLPQSHIPRDGNPGLESPAFGLDKMIGYTRAEPPLWTAWLPIRVRAMVKAGDVIFAAGPPDILEPEDPYAAFEGRKGARLAAVSARDGARLAERGLEAPPVFDGMIAARGRLLIACEDGSVVCLAGRGEAEGRKAR